MTGATGLLLEAGVRVGVGFWKLPAGALCEGVAAGREAGAAAFVMAATGGLAGGAGSTVFAGSVPLRKRPRATRSVPFACSTLMGFVSTRLAPIRNALATPACPSTTATASEE